MFSSIYLIFLGHLVIVSSLSLKREARKPKIQEISAENDGYEFCETEECNKLAKLIKDGMNETVNPCDDFYSYICGSWPSNYPVPEDKFKWNLDAMVEENVHNILKGILQKRSRPEDSVPLTLEKKWFKSCMDEDRIHEKGLEPLKEIIEPIGGWPMAMRKKSWEKKNITWQNVAKYYAGIVGAYSLFSVGIQPDAANSTVQILAIDQASDSLIETRSFGDKGNKFRYKRFLSHNDDDDHDSDESKDIAEKYITFMFNITVSYAESTGELIDNFKDDTLKLLQFIQSLEAIKTSPEVKVNMELGTNKMRISEFQKEYNRKKPGRTTGWINWLEMIQALFKDTEINIDASEEVALLDKPYIYKLAQLLKRTPQRTLVNYVHWSFITDVQKYLSKTTRQNYLEANNIALGVTKEPERWADCLENMPIKDGISAAFVKAHFSNMTKQTTSDMAEEIRKEIDLEISRTTWMNKDTKALARNKLETMKVLIGHPDWYNDPTDFNEYYDGLEMGDDYFENAMNYHKYVAKNTAKSYREPFDKDMWLMSPIMPNAYYMPPTNTLTVPAAQLLVPNFNAKIPIALNYGSVGFIIGHEMSHGFDVTGRKYDENGNVIPWWSDKMIREYDKKARCFVDQFNNYDVDGKLTQNENMADTAGLNAAFGAFRQKMKKENIKDVRLPGLEQFDSNKLFFVSFSTGFCQSVSAQFLANTEDDVHTEASVRINGAVANVKGFVEAFRCKKDKQCTLWS